MKKNTSIISMMLIVSFSLMGQPREITVAEASFAAKNWIKSQGNDTSIVIDRINVYKDSNNAPLIYEISSDKQTLLLSGARNCLPIIGYCGKSDSSIIELYKRKELPCGMQVMLDGYIEQIKHANRTSSDIPYEYLRKWGQLLYDSIPEEMRSETVVGPLLKTLWGQKYPNEGDSVDAYNYHAPSGDSCAHCYAGCTAVAMAQIMNYWTHPVLSQKIDQQFDWCNMAESLDTEDELYEIKRDAVSYLIYKAGYYSQTTYGCQGSRASLENAMDALVNKFSYSSDARHYIRDRLDDNEWLTKLINHMNWGYPVLYAGYGLSGGHSFVCDGYNEHGYFHMNWGYSRYPEWNGFFSLNQLTPGGNNYNWEQEAIFYIHPENAQNMCSVDLSLDYFYLLNPLLSTHYPFEITPQTMTKLVSAGPSSPASWRTIPTGSMATYQAHEEVLLQEGFTVEAGAEFTAQIVPCPNCETRGEDVVEEEPGDTDANPHGADTEGTLDARPSFLNPLTDLYPNPTSGELTVTVGGDVQAIVIYNAMGQPVGGWNMLSMAGGRVTLDVSPLPDGIYLLTVRITDGKTRTGRFVKQ